MGLNKEHLIMRRRSTIIFLAVSFICCLYIFTSPAAMPHDAITRLDASSWVCTAKSGNDEKALAEEIKDYERSARFRVKIDEVRGLRASDTRQASIVAWLQANVLVDGQSLLDLGCAAGNVIKTVNASMADRGGLGKIVGVELVGGWASVAREALPGATILEGDITEVDIPSSLGSFDVVLLNDVLEHVQGSRHGCLMRQIQRATHVGSAVYMHTPSPETQLVEAGQYYENVIRHHEIIYLMALAGFQLEKFEFDTSTNCGTNADHIKIPSFSRAKCIVNGVPKYYHMLFRRPRDVRTIGKSIAF
ncbi:MAG: S-adenosyl-L-methionine-dependent methyltransferase [Monoraphidium minutum]|nr:MAG: S-adenosyl-L-methionine-dependent methyltransferase [Monoraphidium minutum]